MSERTLIYLLLLAFLGGLSAYIVSVIRQAEPAPHELQLYDKSIPLDAKLLQLDKIALDEAYHTHLVKLWTIWLTDGAKESHRFENGLRITRGAYAQAAAAIAAREQALQAK